MRLLRALATVLVMSFGLITFLGLIVGDDVGFLSALVDAFHFRELTDILLRLVVIVVAVTVLIGVLNLISVHMGRIRHRRGGWFYSIVLLVSYFTVIVLTLLERMNMVQTVPGQPSPSMILLETVQVSIESALAGLLLFALVYGASRLMQHRVSWWSVLFTAALLLILLGALPLESVQALADVQRWLLDVPVSAGARGILLGIALATIVTGVRVFIGQDRSYRE